VKDNAADAASVALVELARPALDNPAMAGVVLLLLLGLALVMLRGR
jgi:hypothetical protein